MVHPRNIHTKFEANPFNGLREDEKVKKFTMTMTTMMTDTVQSLESHWLHIYWVWLKLKIEERIQRSYNINQWWVNNEHIWVLSGPRLMTDTQHSTLKSQCIWMGESWVWSVNPECRVLSIHHKFWVQALNLWRCISTLPLKLQHQIHVLEWGILKCRRSHILRSGIPNQIHGVLSVECWVSVISLGPGI